VSRTKTDINTTPQGSGPDTGPGLGAGDIAFLLLLVLALVAVVLSGRFTYREGMLLETAKGNAQEFMKWAESVSVAASKAEPFTLALCASKPADSLAESAAKEVAPLSALETASDAAPATPRIATAWGTCREALFTAGGPLSHLANPFDAVIPVASNKCERRNRGTRGVVYVLKGTQPPPGVPGGTSWSPIEDDDPMVRGLMLRVQACDAGGYTINIGEVKL